MRNEKGKGGYLTVTSSRFAAWSRAYALVTTAYNEDKCLAKVIQSFVAQILRPKRWSIVSDGSTDRTGEIVNTYAAQFPFIVKFRPTS